MSFLFKTIRKVKKRPFCSAVVVAAGSSQRAGVDKLFVSLGGMPVLARTLTTLESCACIDEIVVVTRQEKIVEVARLCRNYGIIKATKIVCGGETRAHSALAGLSETNPKAEVIAIHDGARPLVTEEVVSAVVHAAVLHKAAAPAVPVKDTLKLAEGGTVEQTLARERTVAVQTPQAFQPEIIKAALTNAVLQENPITDDCSAVEALGVQVHLTPGSEENIKLTTPLDFQLAEAILESRQQE